MTAAVIQQENLKAVMDAYRARTGTTAEISLVDLPALIRAIPATASYDLSKDYVEGKESIIVEDGARSIKDYAFQSEAFKQITLPETVTSIGLRAFDTCSNLEGITNFNDLSALRTIGERAFANDGQFGTLSGQTELSLPNLTNIGASAFVSTHVQKINFPKAGVGNMSFQYCSYLTEAVIGYNASSLFSGCSQMTKARTTLASTIYGNSFKGCSALQELIFDTAKTISASAFNGATSLTTLVLKYSSGVSLSSTNAFTNTPFASGGTGGTIYCPQALIDSGYYTTATNWSSLAINQILPIEGSVYDD